MCTTVDSQCLEYLGYITLVWRETVITPKFQELIVVEGIRAVHWFTELLQTTLITKWVLWAMVLEFVDKESRESTLVLHLFWIGFRVNWGNKSWMFVFQKILTLNWCRTKLYSTDYLPKRYTKSWVLSLILKLNFSKNRTIWPDFLFGIYSS